MVPAMTGLGALCAGPGAGGQRRAAQSVPPLGPWSPGVCVPDSAIKTPSWFSCPGVGTTGFQFVSREPPLLGGGEERNAETIWERRREFARTSAWDFALSRVCLPEWPKYLGFG